MVAPAFGFSAGDFVAAIDLTVKIGRALRETGGATSEYRLVQQDLQLLRQALEFVQALQPKSVDAGHVNALRGMVLTCLIPLREFAEKLDKQYFWALSVGSAKNMVIRSGRKAQWAVSAAEEVTKFRAVITAKIVSISMLLNLCNSEALFNVESQMQEAKDALRLELDKKSRDLDCRLEELSVLAEQRQSGLLTIIMQARERLEHGVAQLGRRIESQHHDAMIEAGEQRNVMAKLDRRLDDVHEGAVKELKGLVEICCGMKTANERALRVSTSRFHHLDTQLISIESDQECTRTEMSSGFRYILLQLKMIRAIGENLLANLIPFSEKVVDYLRRNISLNMEIYALLLKIQASIPNRILFLIQDTLHFEDVLGRTKDLPYTYFRHWDVFESMLRCEFKGLPGELKVLQGDYILVNSTVQGLEVDKGAWERSVFPGSQLKMSIIMKALRVRKGSLCPRSSCDCIGELSADISVARCPACGLTYNVETLGTREHQSLLDRSPVQDILDLRNPRTRRLLYMPPNLPKTASSPASEQVQADRQQRLQLEEAEFEFFRMIHVRRGIGPPYHSYWQRAPFDGRTIIDMTMSQMHNLLMKVLESGNSDETLNDICDIAQKAKLQPESDLLYDIIHNVIADYVDTMFTAEMEAILYRTTSDHLRDKAVIVYMDAFLTKFTHRLELLDRVADEMAKHAANYARLCFTKQQGYLTLGKTLENIMDGIVLRIICSTGSLSSEPIKHYVKYYQEALAILHDKQPHRGRRLKESDDESSQDRYTEDRTAEDK